MFDLIYKFIKNPITSTRLILSLRNPILSIIKIKDGKSLKEIDFIRNKEKCIVLGNGPSLKKDFEEIKKNHEEYDFCCVNNFVLSPNFVEFKPTIYVFLDAYFWAEDAHPDWIKQRNETFSLIDEKVDWKMQVFIPSHASKDFIEKKIDNKNVEVIKLKAVSMPSAQGAFAYRLFDSGYFTPGGMNVLIYAVYLAIFAKYKEIAIYGADLSFHKDLDVDQNTNDVIIQFKHFYGGEKKYELLKQNPQKVKKFTMYGIMDTTAKTFFAHEVLSGYAKKLGITVLNKSSYSMIDAYDRK